MRLLIAQGQIHAEGYLDNPNINRLMDPPEGALLEALNQPAISNWVARLELPAVVPEDERRISSVPEKLVEGRYLNGPEDDGAVIGLNLAKRRCRIWLG